MEFFHLMAGSYFYRGYLVLKDTEKTDFLLSKEGIDQIHVHGCS